MASVVWTPSSPDLRHQPPAYHESFRFGENWAYPVKSWRTFESHWKHWRWNLHVTAVSSTLCHALSGLTSSLIRLRSPEWRKALLRCRWPSFLGTRDPAGSMSQRALQGARLTSQCLDGRISSWIIKYFVSPWVLLFGVSGGLTFTSWLLKG